jgi:NADPH-dependent curcumin reductase CurA
MSHRSRELRLRARPEALPSGEHFELVEVDVPEPGEGEVLVRNEWMSVDPYMRGRMREGPSYAEPWAVGEAMQGGAVGRVIASGDAAFAGGDLVASNLGWRELALAPREAFMRLDPDVERVSDYLGALGMPGHTAYVGLLDLGQPQAGETVFVSAAAGAVGSVVGQIAKLRGCRVVGSAGSEEKVAWLRDDLGFDAAINYRTTDLEAGLAEHAPEGVDIYFDNVGHDHLQAALNHLNMHGRVVACGSIAGYNEAEPRPGPNNLGNIVRQRLTIRGFIVSDHADRREAFLADMRRWLAEGEVRSRQTVVEGLERAPEAFLGLFDGTNIGKMVVRIEPG